MKIFHLPMLAALLAALFSASHADAATVTIIDPAVANVQPQPAG
jgi:hypothetical protein